MLDPTSEALGSILYVLSIDNSAQWSLTEMAGNGVYVVGTLLSSGYAAGTRPQGPETGSQGPCAFPVTLL